MARTDLTSLLFDSWALGMEAASVMTLRMARLAACDADAFAEAQLMVAEKMEAAARLQAMALTGSLGRQPATQARRTISHYRRAVAGNRRRLARTGPR